MLQAASAPAKINLSLHVSGRRPDGWHRLESLVAFAGVADRLTFEPGPALELAVRGPTAAAAGPRDDNLVLRAARALAERVAGTRLGRFELAKRLPVAAGLGGGSSDAAAALRLLAAANGLACDDPRVSAAAAATGADVPVCLAGRVRMMRGTGDELGPLLDLPLLPAVLVNPRVAVPTVEVFRRLGLRPGEAGPGPAHPPESALPASRGALIAALAGLRNDLEAPALALAPAIGAVRTALAATGGVRLVRMSGSGATVFALYDSRRAAARAAAQVRAAHPAWWVRSTVLHSVV